MDIRRFKYTLRALNLAKVCGLLIYLLILLIPFTHKEAFSIADKDLIFARFVLTLIAFVGVYKVINLRKRFLTDPFFLLLGIMVAFQVFSLFQTRDVYNTSRIILFQTAVFFSYPVIKDHIASKKGAFTDLLIFYLIGFFIVIVFLGVQMYLQETFGKAIGGVWPVPEFPTRYGSTFWDVNHFGIYLTSLAILVAGFFVNKSWILRGKLYSKSVYILVIILSLIALYFTKSRSSFIGFFVGSLVFAYGYVSLGKGKKSLIYNPTFWSITGFTSVFLPIGILYFFADKVRDFFLYRSVSFFSHLFLLKAGIQAGIENFFLGIGANAFHAYFRESNLSKAYYYIDEAAINFKLPLHNLWLETFVETGVLSFIFFLLFWILLIVGLHRVFKNKKDYVALGLMSGLIAFLTAGFFYSYKSEFFWMYVLISCAYVIYRYPDLLKNVKYFMVSRTFSIKNFLILLLSIFSLLVPLAVTFNPLTPNELKIFYASMNSNVFIYSYQMMLSLFRYIIGNYSFTGRFLSEIFYLGSIFLLIGIYLRFSTLVKSVVITAITANFLAVFVPVVRVSVDWYFTFWFLLVSTVIVVFISKFRDIYSKKIKIKMEVLGVLLVVTLVISTLSSYRFYDKSYDKGLSFLLELSHNRGLFDGSNIWVDETVDVNLVHYYCDATLWNKRAYKIKKCSINSAIEFETSTAKKEVLIGSPDYITRVGKIMENLGRKTVRLDQRIYSALIYEAKILE